MPTPPSAPRAKKRQKPRATSAGTRAEQLAKGAFLIEFDDPGTNFLDLLARPLPAGVGEPVRLTGDAIEREYRTMERKGFLVTRDLGCLIPHAQYCTYQQGATKKGHQRSCAFFTRMLPTQPRGKAATRDADGWPIDLQISHLCHTRACCRIDHLVIEPQWCNQSRNYCGRSGACDCGRVPQCVGPYRTTQHAPPLEYCKTLEEVNEVLRGDRLPAYVVHPPQQHARRDDKASARLSRKALAERQKKENAARRKRRTNLHEHKTAKKRKKLARRAEGSAVPPAGSDSTS